MCCLIASKESCFVSHRGEQMRCPAAHPSFSEFFSATPLLHSPFLCSVPESVQKKQIFTEEIFGKVIKLHIFGTKLKRSCDATVTGQKYGLEIRC
jgi:hypothetical protein